MTKWKECTVCGEYRIMTDKRNDVCFSCEIEILQNERARFFRWALLFALFLICVLVVHICEQAQGGEVEEVRRIAPKYNAEVEVTLWDRTRVDMLNDEYAIEVDWAKQKWAEAIGQALYYSIVTGKKPGIVLLVKDMERERRHIYRCQTVCAKYGIKLWLEKVEDGS